MAPLPDHLPPMLATTGTLPADDGWAFELKWDGVRVIAHPGVDGAVRLETRRLRDVTVTYPEIGELGGALCDLGAVVDGEVVALDETGRPSFQRIQERMNVSDRRVALERAARVPVAYLVFDLLQLDGEPIIDRPYTERRGLLDDLRLSGPSWAVPPAFDGDGQAALDVARDRRLEGVVAKRLQSTYVLGARSRDWRKIKFVERESFVVGGWQPGEGNRSGELGSLLVGKHDPEDGTLRYAGGVGTGFTGATLRMLREALAPLARDDSPFTGAQPPKRTAHFVEPELVVDVEYREITRDGILRQPSYKGLRPDIAPADVVGRRRVGDGDASGAH